MSIDLHRRWGVDEEYDAMTFYNYCFDDTSCGDDEIVALYDQLKFLLLFVMLLY